MSHRTRDDTLEAARVAGQWEGAARGLRLDDGNRVRRIEEKLDLFVKSSSKNMDCRALIERYANDRDEAIVKQLGQGKARRTSHAFRSTQSKHCSVDGEGVNVGGFYSQHRVSYLRAWARPHRKN